MSLIGLFLVSGLAVGSLYSLGAVGLVLLYRATGILNFAYGALGAIGAMSAWQALEMGLPEWAAWTISIGLATILCLIFGLLVSPNLAERDPAVKAIATLGFALLLLGVMNVIWVDNPRSLSLASNGFRTNVFGLRINGTRIMALLAGLIVTFGMGLFLAYTRTGLMMRAIAADRQLASLLGTPISYAEAIAWGVSGALAGFAGMLFGSLVRLDPTTLTFAVIPIIATAIVGRLQSIPAAFIVGLCIGAAESLLTLYQPLAPFRAATPFVVAVVALLWMQRGQRLTFSD